MDIEVIKDQICDVCHKMWQLEYFSNFNYTVDFLYGQGV